MALGVGESGEAVDVGGVKAYASVRNLFSILNPPSQDGNPDTHVGAR